MKIVKKYDCGSELIYLDLAKLFIMPKIIVLGTGLVGSAIAADLASEYDVTAVDFNSALFDSLKAKGASTIQVDLSLPGEIARQVAGYDLVIGALPGHMGFRCLEEVISAGKHMVDISFMPEDYLMPGRSGQTQRGNCRGGLWGCPRNGKPDPGTP